MTYNCEICEDQSDYYIEVPALDIQFLRDCECKKEAVNNSKYKDNHA